jgi:hypothetical protein
MVSGGGVQKSLQSAQQLAPRAREYNLVKLLFLVTAKVKLDIFNFSLKCSLTTFLVAN